MGPLKLNSMKIEISFSRFTALLLICSLAIVLPLPLEAQRRGGSRPSGGGNRSAGSKPASKPAGGNKSTTQPAGGNRATTQPAGGNKATTQPAGGNRATTQPAGGNNTNINNSKNVNINNSRNTVVVANPKPYPRPPYAYGGHSYYAYHPYHYHPYHPYPYPAYHPVGFVIVAVAATAIIVNAANQKYYYDQGIYYVQSNGGYTVVPAPVGATVTTLPPATQTVIINETTNNYYYAGTYYEKKPEGYVVVPPTAGSVVENLPEGGKEEKIGDVSYVKVGETYYQPIVKDGKNMYEVVDVKTDK